MIHPTHEVANGTVPVPGETPICPSMISIPQLIDTTSPIECRWRVIRVGIVHTLTSAPL